MKIQAVKLYENGFMTRPFALGGEDGPDKFDGSVRYRSTVQNFVIDTGSEVILVDTGLPKEYPDMVPDETSQIYLGSRIKDYVSALKELGYEPSQVTKILVTHKHEDHTGELRSFPNAKIYLSPEEADALKLDGPNVVRVKYQSGPYHTFDASEKIADGVYLQITGPAYETPNEVTMYVLFGADAVGMSTGCEAVALKHMGMRILGISCITDMAIVNTTFVTSHEEIQKVANQAGAQLQLLVKEVVKRI